MLVASLQFAGDSLLVILPFAKLPLPGFDPKGSPLLGILPFVMVLGFLLGTFGHVIQSRKLVGFGVAIIFLTTLLLPLIFFRGSK